jgi:CHAT domain-containing protein
VRKLASILPGSISKVVLARPLREVVLSALDTCTMFHFAGHGESHPSDPSKSSLLVTDWKSHPLTVEHLIGSNLSQKSPWLAYLSACSTSESQAENLHDEAIHLVTACQLAGFQHVVGSLWEVSDRYSVNVAEEVYKTIVDGGFIDGEKVSRGVHNAVRRLRDITSQSSERRSVGSIVSGGEEIPDPGTRAARRVRPEGYEEGDTNEGSDPLVWAAYIHVGL